MSKKKKKPDYSSYEDRGALCPHFESCGGCTMQKISYEKQLEFKAKEVADLIEPVLTGWKPEQELIQEPDHGRLQEGEGIAKHSHNPVDASSWRQAFEGIYPSPEQEGYRNKMEFTFGDEYKGGALSLGLHMRGSFMNIVNITDCHLIHQDMNLIRNAIRDFFSEYFALGVVTFRNNKTQRGYLRHLLLRRAQNTGEILVALVTTSQYGKEIQTDAFQDTEGLSEESLLENLTHAILDLSLEGKVVGVLHILNDSTSDVVQADAIRILHGRDYIYEKILDLTFKISVFSFFQTNTHGAEVLYSKAREYASEAKGVLFDLYSGTGTIAQIMSSAADQVIGVEIVPEAVDAAKENALANHISNVSFIAEDVLRALDQLPLPDYIILDPPREGIHPKALGKILRYDIPHILYISCKPSSLARDLAGFLLAGYQVDRACCVDMFPQTGHVETVCLMSRVKE